MWTDPNDHTAQGGVVNSCGLTPYCYPQNPCRITPHCGRPIGNNAIPNGVDVNNANPNVNPQTLSLPNQQAFNGLNGGNIAVGNGGVGMMSSGMPPNGMTINTTPGTRMGTIRGMSPGGIVSGGMVTGGAIPGTLVSRGIVPGASQITSGGMVAAIGVATPAGTMTHSGVHMVNGMVNNNVVLRACVMTPNCTAAHPCGLTQHCGGAVAVNLVANNAAALASTLHAQGVSSGVMQASGMGALVNPMTNQPINGITMAGYPQAGYPPIGYAPSGYAPGYPRYAPGMIDVGQLDEEIDEEEEEETIAQPETRSQMPVPRFHPIPSQPTFQRREGMTSTPLQQRNTAKPTTVSMMKQDEFSEREFEAALD
jgi:hypothetical protein